MYHSAGGKPQYPMSRRSFSFKDRHLLLIILVVFAIICLGSLYYAPEVMEQVSFDVTYRKFIGWQDENNNVLLENADNAAVDDQVAPSKSPVDQDRDVEIVENQEEIIDNHEEVKVEEERRDVGQEEQYKVDENVEEVQQPQTGGDDGRLDNVDPGNSDDVTTKRREKVKEVQSMLCQCVCTHMHIYTCTTRVDSIYRSYEKCHSRRNLSFYCTYSS